MKKKLDALTKAKLIYSGELIIIAIVFLVIAILKITKVIPTNETRHLIINWITLFGGLWVITDFIWALVSKKRRPRISLLDKCLHLPAGLYMVTFDLYCIISQTKDANILRFGFPIAILYLCACYIFEGFYHFYHPVPGILAAVVEEEVPDEEGKEDQQNENNEVNKEEEKQDEIK